jgi:hypothetical protein
MTEGYTTAYLTEQQIERASVLIAAFAPTIPPRTWRDFCVASLSAPTHGNRVGVVMDEGRYLRGLAVFAPLPDAGGNRYLDVPIVAPLSAADAGGVTRAMLEFLEDAAKQTRCTVIRFGSLRAEDWHHYISGEIGAGTDGVTMMLPC